MKTKIKKLEERIRQACETFTFNAKATMEKCDRLQIEIDELRFMIENPYKYNVGDNVMILNGSTGPLGMFGPNQILERKIFHERWGDWKMRYFIKYEVLAGKEKHWFPESCVTLAEKGSGKKSKPHARKKTASK
jgi:hypothetical protein